MKLRQEQVDKLREGKATLVADHSKHEMMGELLEYISNDFLEYYNYHVKMVFYYFDHTIEHFNSSNYDCFAVGELTPLDDFFEQEETGVEEIEFKSYKPKK